MAGAEALKRASCANAGGKTGPGVRRAIEVSGEIDATLGLLDVTSVNELGRHCLLD
jgi:hypothetical protein